jgi:uncharacterized protein (DUF433 family)
MGDGMNEPVKHPEALAAAMRLDGASYSEICGATGLSKGRVVLTIAQAVAEARRRGVSYADISSAYRVGKDFIKQASHGPGFIISPEVNGRKHMESVYQKRRKAAYMRRVGELKEIGVKAVDVYGALADREDGMRQTDIAKDYGLTFKQAGDVLYVARNSKLYPDEWPND